MTTTASPWLTSYNSVPATLPTPSSSILDEFRTIVEAHPDSVLVRYFDTPMTVSDVDRLSDAVAVAFQSRGIEPGDRIAMYLQNVPAAMLTLLGAWKAGAVIVPCNPMLKGRELVKILANSGCRGIVLHDDLYADVAAAVLDETAVEFAITTSALDFLAPDDRPSSLGRMGRQLFDGTDDLLQVLDSHRDAVPKEVTLTSDDVAFMVYTSGTTGAPKGAMNTHGNGLFAAAVYREWMRVDHDTVILGLAPLFHVTGMTGHLVLSLISGAELLLFYRFDADVACRLTERYRATFAVTAITAFTALLASPAISRYDMSSLATVYTGGAPTPTSVIDQWRAAVGSAIHPMYGLTEVTSPAAMTPMGAGYRADAALGVVSIGVPVPNTRIRIVTDEGVEAAPREIGELRISGPQVVPGYWQMPEESASTFEEGELRTGDIGFMDEDGWVYLVDRAKDMIVASGFKVWPSEVEEVLYQHPAVREAGVVGVPDPYRGENVKAYISLHAGATAAPDEIKAFARDRMAAYKYPRIVEILDDLPKTTSGKIMRRMLQDIARGTAGPAPAPATRNAVEYPEVREALEARTVLEIGATWLRLSQGPLEPREAAALYDRLHDVIGTIDETGSTPDRERFLAANERFHETIVDLLGNEHLSEGFRSLGMERLLGRALAGTDRLAADFVTQQEHLVDAIAAGNERGAREAILTWAAASGRSIQESLRVSPEHSTATRWSRASLLEELRAFEPEKSDFASDVDALLRALEARAALEIGITQLLAAADTTVPERARLVARLKAAIPLVRGSGSLHAARYARADGAFHHIIIGLLENERIADLYNGIGLSDALFRVLESTSVAVRDALDDQQSLTAALLDDKGDPACRAIAAQLQEVRAALGKAVAEHRPRSGG